MNEIICDKCNKNPRHIGYQIGELYSNNPYTIDRNELYYCDDCNKFIETEYRKVYYCQLKKEFIFI